MDKLTVISGCLFLAADIFAIASIVSSDWINTGESAGSLTVGLIRQCQTIHGRHRTCIPPQLPREWMTTLFFIILVVLFCMAALIFPMGFYISEVGGQPYKLPNNTMVGSSYVLFILSIFFTIVGLLFAGKVCLPG
ncbi:modulator of smoothened protein-like isoform 2-T2 [Menidia menidia]